MKNNQKRLTLGVSRVIGKNLKLKLSERITAWKISAACSTESPGRPSLFFFFEDISGKYGASLSEILSHSSKLSRTKKNGTFTK